MKNVKKTLVSLCALAFGVCLVSGVSMTTAGATEAYAPDFTIGNYASVRLGDVVEDVDKTGIRFNLFMTQEKYEALSTDGVWKDGVQVGAIVMPTNLLGENDLTTETADVVNIPLYADMWCEATEKDLTAAGITGGSYVTSYAVLYNVPSVCLDWALTAAGYIDPSAAENDTVYTDVSCERSMAQVALAAIEAGEDADVLDKYLPAYEVEFKQGDNVVKSALVKYGSKASLGNVEVTPAKGYFLTGWEDQNGNAYDFDAPVTGDLTLTAVEEHINDLLVFNDEKSLDMVQSATTKEIVQDGDKTVLSATFGGNDVLKINLGSVYNMWNDGFTGVKVYYKASKTETSNRVEAWYNNLGGSIIWDKSAQIDTVDASSEYGVLYVPISVAIISGDAGVCEALLLKSTAVITMNIEKIELVENMNAESWDGFMTVADGFVSGGVPEYVVADFKNHPASNLITRNGNALRVLVQGTGTQITHTQWTSNYIQFNFPKALKASDIATIYFYFNTINGESVFLEPHVLTAENELYNFWQSESVFPNGNTTQLADGSYKLKMNVSYDTKLTADDEIVAFIVTTNNWDSVFFAETVSVALRTTASPVDSWSKFGTQIGTTNEYLLADYADPTWKGLVFGRGVATVTAVRNAAGALTGFKTGGCSWAAQSVCFAFETGLDYTTVNEFYLNFSGKSGGLYAYIYDEVGNGYWAGVSNAFSDSTNTSGVMTVKLPDVGVAPDNGCKADANVTFGMKKIVGILITSDGNTTDTVTISKITYSKK